ncbi:cytochrome P450, partial [Striga asiatica]
MSVTAGEGYWIALIFLVILLGLLTLHHFMPLLLLMRDSRIPKGSFGWPIIGETLSYLKPHPSTSSGAFLQNHCSRYGKVFKSHLFFSPTVISCDKELNHYVLQNEGRYFECSYPKNVHQVLGQRSLLVAVGETHKRLRNVAVSLVTNIKSKPDFLNDIERNAARVLDSWKDKSQARRRISSRVKAIIDDRRKNAGNCCEMSDDFLKILLNVDSLTEAEKLEHETIRSMKKKDELLNWNHYKAMEFTHNVINEALRLGNIVKFVHRRAIQDVKFKDHIIPSGWKVLPIFSAVHLDPSFHVNPLDFNPWRWQKEDEAGKTFTPFGGGSRYCPGFELAKVEVAFFLHRLLQKYR